LSVSTLPAPDLVEVDVLILGGGGAGLCAALHAADASPRLRVGVVVKGLLGRAGCTRMVQGGYNAVLGPPDSLEAHFLDTLRGGAWINDQELVWTLVREAPRRLQELEARYGCYFDRTPEGRLHQKPFAGQSHDRTVHKGDLTGIEIMNRLTEQVLVRPGVRVFEECRALELLRDDQGRAAGALVLDMRTGRFLVLRARATLLATGAGPTMYRVFACSADKAADGLALAFRAGVPLRDMEMVQFHPTGLVIPGSLMTGALLEEGLRGAGGHLRNGHGERFMARYDPERMERATRDLVSRAAFTEIAAGRGSPHGGVWLDVSHLGAAFVERHFRGMVRRCRDFGRDLAREPVEVAPTAHFMMGGVVIDPACRTALEGLFAAGEDAGGVHGANRLGGNGVAESTVFGGIAGDVMAEFVVGRPAPAPGELPWRERLAAAVAPLGRAGGGDLYGVLRGLREVMWEHAGLIRDESGLRLALSELDRLEAALSTVSVPGGPALNLAWQDWLNLTSQLTVARLIVWSALERRESRGAHWRRDFPEPAPEPWYVVCVDGGPEAPRIRRAPVVFTRRRPEVSRLAPARVDLGE
jgi:succinate dehydrogenase/fumarate reductase flavoprotein subunit